MFSNRSLLSCGAAVVALCGAVEAQAQTQSFNLSAQPAVSAIPEFARQARIQVIAPARDLGGVRTSAVRGDLDVREALSRLIAGTPLRVASQERGVITLRSTASAEASGSLSGRVLDPATGQYMPNAVVRAVDASGELRSIVAGEGGEFRLSGLSAGDATVTASFTGYADQSGVVTIRPNETARLNFDIFRAGDGGATVVSDVVVTGSARDADARAIMAQRESMNITEVLSAESYGDIGDTNPAEFLKYMPGVDTDGTNGTAISVNLRGLPANYTTVTVNGMNFVTADANTGSGSARVFSFESMSLVGIESIEIEKTTSADVDANAPAGRINIQTNKAFNRRKSLLTMQLSAATHENMWDDSERTGPQAGGWRGRRFLPNAKLSYSNSFFDRRLGVAASIGRSDTYIEREQLTISRNYVPTAVSPDPLGITAIEFSHTARETSRTSANLNLDFRATEDLTLSLMGVANRGFVYQATTAPTFTTGVRTRGVDGDALYDFTTKQAATTTYAMARSNQYKINNSNFIAPTFEWSRGNIVADGYFSYSQSESYYDSPEKGEVTSMTSALSSTGNFTAVRSADLYESDWKITQISGPDWGNPGSFGLSSASARPVIRTTNGSTSDVTNYSGAVNLVWSINPMRVPVELKTGFKFSDTTYEFNDTSGDNLYTYNGPLSNAQFLQEVQGVQQISFDDMGAGIKTLSGGGYLYSPNLSKLYDMFSQNPEQWTRTLTAANWLASRVTNFAQYEEATQAAYVMATATPLPNLRLRAGLRWERTDTSTLEFDPRSPQELKDAGFAVNAATGNATTIEGLEYQYFDQPRVERKGEYDFFFPSASLKYELTPQTVFHVGYSRTILRPEPDVLSGVVTRDDLEKIVRAPNPGLKPALSDNYSVRLEHYFEPVGLVSFGLYQNTIEGLFQSYEMTAAEFGNTDPELADYTFITTATVPGEAVSIRGAEFAFNHALSYLPGPLGHLRARGSFMYNDPDVPIVRVANKIATLSLSYSHRKLKMNLNNVWTDDKYRSTTPSWFAARLDTSLNGSYRLSRGYEAFFSVSNLLNNNINVIVPGSLDPTGVLGDHSAINVHNGRHGQIGLRVKF